MTNKYFYEDTGLAFKDFPEGAMLQNLKDWRKRINKNSFASIIITSPQGRGKTTLAVQILKAMQRTNKPDYECQIAFGFDDFRKKLGMCRERGHKVIIFDEAGEISSRDALSEANKEFLRILDLYRAYKIFLIICLQRISMLDSAVMETEVIRACFYIKKRGDKSALAYGYSLADMFKILGDMHYIRKNKLGSPNLVFEKHSPMLRLKFKPLPDIEQQLLDELSYQAKQRILNSSQKDDGINQETLLLMKKKQEIFKKLNEDNKWTLQ